MDINGVSHYTHGTTEVTINFPNGDEVCRWCWVFLKYEENYKRYSCKKTGEWILDPIHCIGEKCPLKIRREE